jgi:hypothetical protein
MYLGKLDKEQKLISVYYINEFMAQHLSVFIQILLSIVLSFFGRWD